MCLNFVVEWAYENYLTTKISRFTVSIVDVDRNQLNITSISVCRNPYHLIKVLRDIRPRYVVIYDAEIQFVRQVEVRILL